MGNRSMLVILMLALLSFAAFQTFYAVSETERAVLLEFGRVIEADIKPGFHLKKPFINEVKKFDSRTISIDAQPQRFFTLEKKALIIDSYVMYRISDVQTYYTATSGDEFQAARLLAQRVNNGLRDQVGERAMHDVVSSERELLMKDLIVKLSTIIRGELGIELVDIRIKRIDLPEDVSSSVYERMKSERDRLAREYRSRGKEQAETLRAKADREKVVISANAYREAEQLRGEGDAVASATYAAVYKIDPEFYGFYRSLNAYGKSFNDRKDLLVLSPNSDFFKYFKEREGAPKAR